MRACVCVCVCGSIPHLLETGNIWVIKSLENFDLVLELPHGILVITNLVQVEGLERVLDLGLLVGADPYSAGDACTQLCAIHVVYIGYPALNFLMHNILVQVLYLMPMGVEKMGKSGGKGRGGKPGC